MLTTLDKETQVNIVLPVFKPKLWELKSKTYRTDPKGFVSDNTSELGINCKIEEYERIF